MYTSTDTTSNVNAACMIGNALAVSFFKLSGGTMSETASRLEGYRVGPLPSVYVVPDFLNTADEQALVDHVRLP